MRRMIHDGEVKKNLVGFPQQVTPTSTTSAVEV